MKWEEIFQSDAASAFTAADATQLVPLTDYALVLAEGLDTEKFLQGQCTCDFGELARENFVMGAHCTPKGRMNCSFVAAPLGREAIALRVHHSVAEHALQALKKYAVFSKVDLSISASHQLFGLVGPDCPATTLPLPQAGKYRTANDVTALCHKVDQIEFWCASEEFSPLVQPLAHLPAQGSSNVWRLRNIRRGIGEVEANTIEKLLPQEINFQLTNGISFNKGCYTGQEIIARLHYRGQLKKHMYRAVVDATEAPTAGDPIYAESQSEKSVGVIINVARSDQSRYEFLALCDDSATDLATCVCGPNTATKIRWLPLPYAIR